MQRTIREHGFLAIEVVTFLASHPEERFPQKNISIALGTEKRYLEPILQKLANGCLLNSERGPRGGYQFTANANAMSAADVLKLFWPIAKSEKRPIIRALLKVQYESFDLVSILSLVGPFGA